MNIKPLFHSLTAGAASLSLMSISSCSTGNTAENRSAGEERPNVLWIFAEDICPLISSYGYELNQTPNIDRLAQNGVLFKNAYATTPVSSAARSAIITGYMPTTLGVHNHHSSRTAETAIWLPDNVRTIPEIFREAGYYTYNNGKDDYNFMYNRKELYSGEIKTNYWYTLVGGGHWRDPERKPGQPFFGQIQLEGGKYALQYKNPSSKYQKVLPPEERMDSMRPEVLPYMPDHPLLLKDWALHHDAVRMVDYDVQRILKELEEDGLLRNTIVFFISDHGYEGLRHKQFLYDGGLHVPFIVSYFGDHEIIKHGVERSDLVSGIDFGITALALAGLDIPEGVEGRNVFAKDFHRDYIIGTRDRMDFTIDRIRAVRSDRYKYIRNFHPERSYMQPQYRDTRVEFKTVKDMYEKGELNEVQAIYWKPEKPVEELYDIENDPHEIKNLSETPEYKEILEEHRAILDTWIRETDDKGQYPEDIEGLRFIVMKWGIDRCVNPEYDTLRKNPYMDGTPPWARK
ncbi:MAG: sulfatase [Bacteroidales bacterium]|jgi:arylsulfatase A-like enzyme|nr:sulfatase [Bacteroidales bacterium]